MAANKGDVFLAVLPVVLARNWDGDKTTPDLTQIALDVTDEVWSVLGKMSKSSEEEKDE